jgi:hypothetical protein
MEIRGSMRLSDISAGGCFVDTAIPVSAGTDVTLRVKIENTALELTGRIVNVQPRLGFGVEFYNLSDDMKRALIDAVTRINIPPH